jgi:hypothetical protein
MTKCGWFRLQRVHGGVGFGLICVFIFSPEVVNSYGLCVVSHAAKAHVTCSNPVNHRAASLLELQKSDA